MRKYLALMCVAMFLFAASKGTGMVTPTRVAQPPVNEPAQPVVTVDRTGYYPSQPEASKSYFVPVTYGNATEIAFSNGIAFNTRNLGISGEPALPEDLKISYQDNESGYYIIQFGGPVYKAQRDWVQSKGIDIHFYIPNYGFVCTIKSKAQADDIRANPAVNWVGIYQPAYKISALFDRQGPETKVVILLFLDADLSSTLDEVRAITNRSEFDTSNNGINKMIFGVVNKDQLHQLARIKSVYWIEPDLEKIPHNQQYQWVVMTGYHASAPGGTDNVARRMWGMGILGQGEIVGHGDSGINTSHYAARSGSAAITTWGVYPAHNAIVAYDSGALTSILYGDISPYHGSHTSGTISGDDTTHAASYYDGIAKMARIYHNDCGGASGTSIYTYGDLNELFIRSYNKYYGSNGIRAYSHSNSWGSSAYGAYTATSLASDQFMWGHKDYLIYYSMGNDGGPNTTVGAPASAKNVCSVGGTSNSTSCRTFYSVSSRGPCTDGRMKPDILTPGSGITSSTSGTATYSSMSGTSMACPGAAGAGALVRQYLREGWYPYGKKVAGAAWPYISAAMVKAVLINSGDNDMSGYTTPNNNTGWGRVDLDSALYFNGDARKTMVFDDTIGVLTGERVEYHFNVPSGAANLKIAVVWTDYPGTPAASRQLVNDIDVTVIGGGSTYLGNVYSGGESVTGGSRDSLNIVECARRNSPAAGDWLVRIEGRNIPLGPQPFALVISYNAASVAGAVTTDKPMYRANDFFIDTVRVRVEDTNFGTVGVRDTVRVTIHGKYIEAQVETLKCAELAESAYVFKGSIPLLFHKPVHGDNRVSVCQGDTLTVTYVDANPAYTCYTWAAIDADYFIISNVHCENIDAFSVEACWTTNDNSTSKVYYGTNPSNLNLTAQLDTPYMIPHRIKISGLSSKTTYYYDVESRDFRGNQVRDNNHGAHYSFTTKGSAGTDVLVVLLNSNLQGTEFAHPAFLQYALTSGGWTYNWWNTRDNGMFTRNQLKQYKAVYFQVGQENYPVWTVAQKETIKLYHDGGARFSMTGHDAGWDPWANSPTADTLFCKNYLHFRYRGDIVATTWTTLYGMPGDPISGAFTGGITYQPFRQGAAGDSILLSGTGAAGTGTFVWHGNTGGDSCAIKWESTANMGSLGDGIWGGYHTRVVHNGWEITQIDTTNPTSVNRTTILNNGFIWLIGHDHPDVTLSSPVGGNTYTTSPVSIAWTATAYGGTTIDSTWIEYSPDAGQTWFTILAGTGITSPYSWIITSLSNGGKYQVKVTVSDAGVYPSMKGFAQTTNFTLNRTGGDLTGPVTIPNSIVMLANANPKIVTPAAGDTLVSFTAVISDSNTGLSTIGAARWFIAGYDTFNCYANDGSYNSVLETVRGDIRIFYLPGTTDICSLYVRGRDNAAKALNWGIWYMRTFTLIDGGLGINVDEFGTLVPFSYGLSVPLPNPSVNHIKIAFALPHPKKVRLNVYNSVGQLVKTLIDENRAPGVYNVVWDGTDDNGRSAAAGIYFYQYSTDEFKDTKKAVLIR